MFYIHNGCNIFFGSENIDSDVSKTVNSVVAKGYLDAITLNINATGISLDFSGMNALIDARHEMNAGVGFYPVAVADRGWEIRQEANHSFH